MQIELGCDELYPFYNAKIVPERPYNWTAEVTDEWWERYQRVMAEFSDIQKEINIMWRQASDAN